MKIKSILSVFILVLFSFSVGCSNGNNDTTDSEEKLSVYTTIFPLEDFTKKIGGEHVFVTSVYPPGADAHTFEPSTKTMSDMASGDAFIYTGVGVEGFADKAKNVLENENVKIVAAGHGIELRDLDDHDEEAHEEDHDHDHDEEAHEEDHDHDHDEEAHEEDHDHDHNEEAHEEDHDHDHNEEAHEEDHDHNHDEEAHEEDHDHDEEAHEEDHDHDHEEDTHDEDHDHKEDDHHDHDHSDGDPHVWLDPTLAIVLAENIKNALVELKPDAKEDFEANFTSLKEDLEKLDSEYKEAIESAKTNKILVSHAAYGYWESRYGIEQISVTGLSPTQEPSQRQLTEIIHTARENNIQYVIFDQNISGKIAEVVKNEIKAEAITLHNLEAVTQEDVDNEEDYLSLMRQNLENLKKALN